MSHADSCAVDCHFFGTDSRIVNDFASAENIAAGHATFTTSHRISTLPMSDRTALSDDDPHVRITRTHTGKIPRISESDCAILADAELHVVMSEASDDPHIPDCATFTARKTPTFDCYKFAAADSSVFFVTLKAIDPCPRVTTLYADKDPRSTMSHAGDSRMSRRGHLGCTPSCRMTSNTSPPTESCHQLVMPADVQSLLRTAPSFRTTIRTS